MSRYFDPPEDYKPALVFKLRQQPEGGNLLPDVQQEPSTDSYARIEAVVLVHGFNNHYGEAGNSYHHFRLRQYKCATPQLLPPGLEAILADLFWPGDAAWWGFLDLFDFLVYPKAVGTSRDAAPLLARHLRSMPNLRAVHFVGHSLGCRVILETIDDIRQNGGPVVGKVCLMAAAVPLFKVQSGGRLADAIEHAEEVRILYSDDDRVCRDIFPPGQTLARGKDEGFFPTALGLNGPVGVAARTDPVDIKDAGHSDYWGDSEQPSASVAADRIAEFFHFGSWQRTIASRGAGMAPRPSTAGSRDVGYEREI